MSAQVTTATWGFSELRFVAGAWVIDRSDECTGDSVAAILLLCSEKVEEDVVVEACDDLADELDDGLGVSVSFPVS